VDELAGTGHDDASDRRPGRSVEVVEALHDPRIGTENHFFG
jgi:hypothetical protein